MKVEKRGGRRSRARGEEESEEGEVKKMEKVKGEKEGEEREFKTGAIS